MGYAGQVAIDRMQNVVCMKLVGEAMLEKRSARELGRVYFLVKLPRNAPTD
jgi:hypothetical protein